MAEQRRRRVNVVAGDRRRELCEAASGIVREEGFGAATVKAITARAGMSAGLLYTYVDSVDDLLAEVFRQCAGAELTAVDDAVHAAPDDARARLVALIETFAARALRGRRLAWALLAEPVGRSVDEERLAYRRGYAALLEEIVRQGIASEVFAPQDPAITAAGLVGAIGEALTGPLSPVSGVEDAPDPESVVATITALCLRAVGER